MLLRIALVFSVARRSELPPEHPVLDHHKRVAACKHEELRSDPELLERHLRHHREPSSGGVPLPEVSRLGENLDEALVPPAHSEADQLGVGLGLGGQIERSGSNQRVINIPKRVERHTILREHSEERIRRIVDDRRGEKAARGGD